MTNQGPDYDLWLSFRNTHEAIHKVRKVELRPYKLSTIESSVLVTVYKANNSATPSEISRELLKDAHSISQLLGRMEKRGLLNRIKGIPRKNMVKVSLTNKGLKAYEQSTAGERIGIIMSILNEEEKKEFRKYLDKLRDRASEILH